MRQIILHNGLTREKEIFRPIVEGFIGMYVCGPTVYSDVHLGNCRTFVSFDIIYRYLKFIGYKIRYIRNITDVGHLLDDGEDRMAKGAKQDQLEPMEVAQKYTNGFHDMMRIFNTQNPSIEPRATGHIIEQIEMVQSILDNGFGYNINGSVYFDTLKYNKQYSNYGQLSGRVLDELLAESRDNLKNQEEKRHPSDFAIWIKASEEHLMKWNSPWSVGFPGWHLECSAMSTKYLGEHFDIHGGGNDLKFPHHENEIAQNMGSCGKAPANYWLHTNMLLLNGRKMSKSEGNTISPAEMFSGNSSHISKGYNPMVVKFFMLQAHYGSTLDITDDGLQAAEKGYKRIVETMKILNSNSIECNPNPGVKDTQVETLMEQCYVDMCDDFNVPKTMANLFELSSIVNAIKDKHLPASDLSISVWNAMAKHFNSFVVDVFGLRNEEDQIDNAAVDGLMNLILDLRKDVREKKDWSASDKIRDGLKEVGIQLKDGKEGTEWIITH